MLKQIKGQLGIFSRNLNVIPRLKETMRESIRKSSLSREQIADKMYLLAKDAGLISGRGTTISLTNLDAWVAAGKTNLIPLAFLPLFCCVTGDLTPINVLVAPLDGEIIGRKDAKLLTWARIEIQSRNLERRKSNLLAEIARGENGEH